MKIILDPALFFTTQPGVLSPSEDVELQRVIDDAVRLCRRPGFEIVAAGRYWKRLQQDVIRPLEAQASPRLRSGLDTLRFHAKQQELPVPAANSRKRVWGFKQLFENPPLDSSWLGLMESVLLGCVLVGGQFAVLTRLWEGRNLKTWATGGCTLREKTRWRLHVEISGRAPQCIPCVRSTRNIDVEWTQRYDERLPASFDHAKFPFCPPAQWWRRHVPAFRTLKSKPSWIDSRDNGWARPVTGGGYHWDVFISNPKLAQAVGLSQINIVQWSLKPDGVVGDIHHVPTGKQTRFKSPPGWSCT